MSYESLCEEIARYERIKGIHDRLHELDIPYTLTRYAIQAGIACTADSGFKMGEKVLVRYRGVEIVSYDKREDYARSCKWSANHGEVVFDFTSKKALRDYCEACRRCCLDEEHSEEHRQTMKDILTKQFNPVRSYISSRKKIEQIL